MLLLAFLFLSERLFYVDAVQASPHSFQHRQPDNTLSPPLFVKGNHKFHIVTDTNGFTVIGDEEDGWVVYASLNNTSGQLRPTTLKVGLDDPFKAVEDGLLRGPLEMPSLEVQSKMCGKFCQNDLKNSSFLGYNDHYSKSNQPIQKDRNTKRKMVSNGIIRNLVVLIRFADHDNRELPSADDISVILNKHGGDQNLAPTGSVRDVFRENSYGKLDVISTVLPWYRLPNTEMFYADEVSGTSLSLESALLLSLANLDNNLNVNIQDFDKDGDGTIDALMFMHSGYSAEWGGVDCYGRPAVDRIWAHKWNLRNGWVSKSGVKASQYHISSALWSNCGKDIARIGTLAHELGHMLGLPDLYSTGSGIGLFGLMGNSWGFDGSQRYPPMMSPWSKIQLGWVTPKEITQNGIYEIEASALKPDIYIISSPYPSHEYLLIENRQPLKFDSKLPQGGLIIWHIDGTVSFKNSPGYPGQPGWPENGNHYHVAVLQADGRYDLERGANHGDNTDVWHSISGRYSIGPSLGKTGVHPNTNSYQNGIIRSTGITISHISSSSHKMSFFASSPTFNSNGNSAALSSNLQNVDSNSTEAIFTTMQGENGSYGIMFEIGSISAYSVTVRSLSFHTRSRSSRLKVEIYTIRGTHLNTQPSEWTLVADTFVSGMGFSRLTNIPDKDFADVTILPGEKQSFFIMLNTPDMRYSSIPIEKFLYPFVSDSNIEILTGSGVGKWKFEQLYSSRIFNGEVRYSVETGVTAVSNVIQTTFNHNNGGQGSMFDVKVLKPVIVTRIDIHTTSTSSLPVEIWTKKGSHKSFEQNQGAWTKIVTTKVRGRGMGLPTPIQLEDNIEMHEGGIHAFYIYLESSDLRYTNGEFPVANKDLEVLTGTGVLNRFGKSFYPRSWNGALHYSVYKNGTAAATAATAGTESTTVGDMYDIAASIETTYKGGNGSYGCIFDIVAKNAIVITSLDIHTRLTKSTLVTVYTSKGGQDVESQSWGVPIFNAKVDGQGTSKRTPLPKELFTAIYLMPGDMQAFYVTLDSPDLRYTNGISVERSFASNDDLSIMEGTGVGSYNDFSRLITPRVFNGVVHYEKDLVESNPIVQLSAGVKSGIRAYGIIFSVEGKRNIKITSMSIHTSSIESVLVEVWTRKGSHMENMQNLNGWNRIVDGFVKGNGTGSETIIPRNLFTTAVEVNQYSTQAFYISLRQPSMLYSKLGSETIIAANEDLQITFGHGIAGYPLLNARTYYPRGWNGSLYYRVL